MNPDNSFSVATFGIPEFERELVQRIFAISESRENVYRIADATEFHAADFALVDNSDEDAAEQYRRLHSGRECFPSVVIASGEDIRDDYWVKRPFTVMRMLGTLDRLVQDRLSGADRPGPAPAAPMPAATPSDESHAPAASPPTAGESNEPAASPPTAGESDAPAASPPTAGESNAPAASPPTAGATSASPTARADTHTALVVDDSLPVRKQLNFVLRRAGVAAEFAEDGESALHLIETRNYDIVYLDVVLPGKGGLEVCKAIKNDESKKHIPIVMLTSRASKADQAKGKLAGCDAYLTKPVSLDEFNQTLIEWLDPPPSIGPPGDA